MAIAVIEGTRFAESPKIVRKYMISPADPTLTDTYFSQLQKPVFLHKGQPVVYYEDDPTSYAFNIAAFAGPLVFPTSLTDGTSNTVALCERYFQTVAQEFRRAGETPEVARLKYLQGDAALPFVAFLGNRRPSFADAGWGDVLPVTTGGVTRPSVPGMTFQVKPKPDDADRRIPQTPFTAGLTVALFDGSVRTIRPSVSETAFWATVTPRGGEVVSLN